MKTILLACMASLFLAACGANTFEGKTAEDWAGEAKKLAEEKQKLEKEKETPAPPSTVSVPGAVKLKQTGFFAGTPCLEAPSTAADGEKQKKACEAWTSAIIKNVEAEDAAQYKKYREDLARLWKEYPIEMAKLAAIKQKKQDLGNYESGEKEEKDFLAWNALFAAVHRSVERFPHGNKSTVQTVLYKLREFHEAALGFTAKTRD